MKLFHKWIVITATSVKKCFLLSTNFMYLTKNADFSEASEFLYWPDPMITVTAFFSGLYSFKTWRSSESVKTMFLFFEDRNLLTLKLNYSAINCLQTTLCLTLPGTALVAFTYIVFLHDVTAFILLFQNNETAAMLVFQTSPVGIELFSYVNAFFCSHKFA